MFIVSPFGFPFDSLYKDGSDLQKDLDDKCRPDHAARSDQTMRLGSIMCQGICKEIIEKQYLLADISLPNPGNIQSIESRLIDNAIALIV